METNTTHGSATDSGRNVAHLMARDLILPTDQLSWEALNAAARIVFTPDDRPIRTIVTGRRRIVTGFYNSRKTGRRHPFESMNEQAFCMLNEVDTRVVDYRAQPFRFEFVLDGAKRIYIPDCARLLDDGTIEIVEVKADRKALSEPDYADKLLAVDEICRRQGWLFRFVTRSQIVEPTARFKNIDEVQSRRMVAFDASHTYVVADHLDQHEGSAPLGRLAEALGDRRVGSAIVKAMMVARHVNIDLAAPIGPDTLVTSVVSAPPTPRQEALQ